MEKVVLGVEERSVPNLIQIAMECVGAGLGEIVNLGYGISALIDGKGIRVDCCFLDRVEPNDEICGEADIQSKPRIVRIVSVEDVADRRSRQAIEFDVSVAAGRLGII